MVAYRLFFRALGLPFPCTCLLSLPCLFSSSSPTRFSRVLRLRLLEPEHCPRHRVRAVEEVGQADYTRELEEERVMRELLEKELREERSAAALAASEAMAMIQRLQKEKASLENEYRKLRRDAVEKSAFDKQEIEELKEILLRREREILVLERELESFADVDFSNADEVTSQSTKFGTVSITKGSTQASYDNMLPARSAVSDSSAVVFSAGDRVWSDAAAPLRNIPFPGDDIDDTGETAEMTFADSVWGNIRGHKGLLGPAVAENDAFVYDVHVVDNPGRMILDDKVDEQHVVNLAGDTAAVDSRDGIRSDEKPEKMKVEIFQDEMKNWTLAATQTYEAQQLRPPGGNSHELKNLVGDKR